MNWNYWLPWRDYPQGGGNDSSYEEEVIDRCDHNFTETTELRSGLDWSEMEMVRDFMVVPQKELVEQFCKKCGEPGFKGKPYPYENHDYEFAARYNGQFVRTGRKIAFKPDFIISPDASLEDALDDPEEDDEPGRVLVNQSEEAEYGVTD